jgi:Gpi18-like mannosyltransferase
VKNFSERFTTSVFFPVAMWLLSRAVLLVGIALSIHMHPHTLSGRPLSFGLDTLAHMDSWWYQQIAMGHYEYLPDGRPHTIAFFPLFPLLMGAGMRMGLSFLYSGLLINNVAFLGAVILLFFWLKETQGKKIACWSVAALVWCPMSLFGTVVYTEGLYLLLTIAALWAFDREKHVQAALWGGLATATRVTGVALFPAMLAGALFHKNRKAAVAASVLTLSGIVAFSLYCGWKFHDPLAFAHAQRAWRGGLGLDWKTWVRIFIYDLDGPVPETWGPLKPLMVFGGGYLLWRYRMYLSLPVFLFGAFSVLLMIFSGGTASLERYAFGTIPLAIVFGVLLARHPRWGTAILIYGGAVLAFLAARFAREGWVG